MNRFDEKKIKVINLKKTQRKILKNEFYNSRTLEQVEQLEQRSIDLKNNSRLDQTLIESKVNTDGCVSKNDCFMCPVTHSRQNLVMYIYSFFVKNCHFTDLKLWTSLKLKKRNINIYCQKFEINYRKHYGFIFVYSVYPKTLLLHNAYNI